MNRLTVVLGILWLLGCGDRTAVRVLDRSNLDSTCSPCDDFFQHANGGWMRKNPIPGDLSRWGSFDELRDQNNALLRQLLEEVSARREIKHGSSVQKVRDFYLSGMDTATVENSAGKPLEPILARIREIPNTEGLIRVIGYFHQLPGDVAFHPSAEPDFRDSRMTIFTLSQGGLGLPDKSYYLGAEFKDKQIQDEYINHITKMFYLLGEDAATAERHARTVMELETALAEGSMDLETTRNPDSTYHRMTRDELERLTPGIPWSAYLESIGLSEVQSMNVAQPRFFATLEHLIRVRPLGDWQAYLRWHAVKMAAPYLSTPYVNLNFLFYGTTLSGVRALQPRWKRVATAIDRWLPDALGQLYVEKAFSPRAKEKASHLVDRLLTAYRARMAHASWMSEDTRAKAFEKLDSIRVRIGYPDLWQEYAELDIHTDHYFENVLRAASDDFRRQMSKVGKPVDRKEWHYSPVTVNASYSPQRNDITFPAGILQWPFFSPDADDAFNFGSMGAVIGHELTHGFDDEGRKYDAVGNVRDWWSREDAERFEGLAAILGHQVSQYRLLDMAVNSELTMGENIADLGGLLIAYDAYHESLGGQEPPVIDGWTGDQRFFLAWAQIWRQNIREEAARMRIKTDPHAPARFRVNGPLSNMTSFTKAFGCKEGDAMVRPDSSRVTIW